MLSILLSVSRIFWPDIDTLSEQRKLIAVGEIITSLYSVPLSLIGIFWLVLITAPNVFHIILQEWMLILLILGLIILFERVNFFYIVEIRENRYGSTSESFSTMVHWSAVFLLGPSAIWIIVAVIFSTFIWRFIHTSSRLARWNLVRNLSLTFTSVTLAKLIALNLYQTLGGQFPIPSLTPGIIIIAVAAISFQFILTILFSSGYLLYHIYVQKFLDKSNSLRPLLIFILFSYALPYLSHPFAILASGLYVQNGIEVYTFFLIGMLLVAYLARKLSWLAESSRQQSRQLERLENLGRDIINSPLDASTLPQILEKHVSTMFPSGSISIWLSPDQVLFQSPSDWPSVQQETWDWLLTQEGPKAFLNNDPLPWIESSENHNPTIVTPILTPEANRPIGGIYLELRTLAQPWSYRSLSNLFPALQSLAALIASVIHRAEIYKKTLIYQEISQELKLAGSIQSSFLPNKFPAIPGWQLAVSLLPARETSGDFFDVIELNNKKLGILIADVADKGVGPALYMALSRTLIRTYAEEYEAEPEIVFFATNQRLHRDARANLFVTAFYGILDPHEGTLTYSNAGHNPPLLIKAKEVGSVISLGRTGIPLGVEIDDTWSQETVNIDPGDVLLLYTDGIPDAQNEQGQFFDEDRLIELGQNNSGLPAHELQNVILTEIQKFIGNSAQFDDITLMILVRDL
jgi:serine phosphatase RsbU (regulator of sigma subunit)